MIYFNQSKGRKMQHARKLFPALAALTLATTLAGCGTAQPVRVAALKGSVDDSATRACGKTRADQRMIDRTTESGAQAGLWDRPKTNPKC
jgi:hypothetical protein